MFIKLKDFLEPYSEDTQIQIETYADVDGKGKDTFEIEYVGSIKVIEGITGDSLLEMTVDYVEVIDNKIRIVVYY